jgi:hypothetical protein
MPTAATSPSTEHRHLTRDERQQALALVGIVVKITHGRVPHKVEETLHDIGMFLQHYGEANNRLPKQRFHQARENLIAFADQAERVA